jgi:hypothetical protein
MGQIGVGGIARDAQPVAGEDAALARDHEIEIGVLAHDLRDVAVVFDHQINIARQQHVLPVVVVEGGDIGFLADEHGLDLFDHRRVAGIGRVAQILGADLEQFAGLAQKGDAALVGIGIEHPFPAVGNALHLRLAIADAGDDPGIGHRIAAARIERRIEEARGDIAPVGDFRGIERGQQIGRDHALDEIVRGHDHVIALVAAAQLGEQFVVVGKQADVDTRARRSGEIGDGVLADIGVPGVEVERARRLAARAACHGTGKAEADAGKAGIAQEHAAGNGHRFKVWRCFTL